MRVIAVDWSGDTHTARSHIWLAEAFEPGRLARLESGRDRNEIACHLAELPPNDLVVGLDFAFSFPAWFVDDLGVKDAPGLWAYVAAHGEDWLKACQPPFWGRRGCPRPPLTRPALRRTDAAVPRTAGVAPKSVFQIGGAGAVGTGSIRGMPVLQDLHNAGARIWPFTEGIGPLVLEIYPRLLTGPVHKSKATARQALLQRYPGLNPEHRARAIGSEDAFDAAVSALVMAEYASDLASLPEQPDPYLRVEGRIWHPRWRDDRLLDLSSPDDEIAEVLQRLSG